MQQSKGKYVGRTRAYLMYTSTMVLHCAAGHGAQHEGFCQVAASLALQLQGQHSERAGVHRLLDKRALGVGGGGGGGCVFFPPFLSLPPSLSCLIFQIVLSFIHSSSPLYLCRNSQIMKRGVGGGDFTNTTNWILAETCQSDNNL